MEDLLVSWIFVNNKMSFFFSFFFCYLVVIELFIEDHGRVLGRIVGLDP